MPPTVFLMSPIPWLTPTDVGGCEAGGLVLDLSITLGQADRDRRRLLARDLLVSCAALPRRPELYVKISAFAGGQAEGDIAAVMAAHPDGILLSACDSAADVQHLDVLMSVHEAEQGRTGSPAGIIAEFGATAAGVLSGSSYRHRSRRLTALLWNDAALAGEVGLSGVDEPYGHDIARLGRAMAVLRASEAGITALTHLQGHGAAKLQDKAARARADGFSGVVTTEPGAIATLRTVFSP